VDTNQGVFVRFLFIGEGPYDDYLAAHLRRCCILAGADEAEAVSIPISKLGTRAGRTAVEKVEFALGLEPNVNLLFIHRDADSIDPEPRYEEIRKAIQTVDDTPAHVAIVPVQETEAWLLLDEQEIRRVAENPKGTIALDIPSASQVEKISSPKEHLRAIILEASEQTGRRYRKTKQKINQKCRSILDGLDPGGPVCEVPSWKRMFSDLQNAIKKVPTIPSS